jgi:hypothetical protein
MQRKLARALLNVLPRSEDHATKDTSTSRWQTRAMLLSRGFEPKALIPRSIP